jgi:two-component system response regulator AtoC
MVGDSKPTQIDVRVIAATSRNLEQDVKNGAFREDLYYRLNVLSIKIPPLRDRAEDIPLLCDHFVQRFNRSLNKKITRIAPAAMSRLLEYPWPGNVRELENAIERALVLVEGDVLLPEHFPSDLGQQMAGNTPDMLFDGFSLKAAQKMVEEKLITRALKETRGNRTQAARLLEISHPSLLTKIKLYNIDL